MGKTASEKISAGYLFILFIDLFCVKGRVGKVKLVELR